MEKREYVKRLKSMLANRKDACECCPFGKYYSQFSEVTISDCKICQSFNGLKHLDEIIHEDGGISSGCPCYRPGKLGAVTRALKKIEEYEAKHGEV